MTPSVKAISDVGLLGSPERITNWQPRPRDLPAIRAELLREWSPGGGLRRIAPVVSRAGGHEFAPAWETGVLQAAELWFVGSAMCDLLAAAAPTMPPTPLSAPLVPDPAGLVIFQTPLAGIDAEGSDRPVLVSAYLWGPAIWQGVSLLGVTVYGPSSTSADPVVMWPVGGLTWRPGCTTDESEATEPSRAASMIEDRRLLAALWVLSQQPGLATSVRNVPQTRNRQKLRRNAPAPEPVRVVHLRHAPAPDHDAPTGSDQRRTYRHRWAVSGHWRQQAYGRGWSERRPLYINPYLKGPEGAPIKTGQRVKAWTR